MEIYLIRHGQTDANKQSIIQGRVNNPLNKTGIEQAKKTGQYLKNLGLSFDYCVSSPLSRAIDTANIIKDQLNIDMHTHIEDQLIERDFGSLDGKKIPKNYFNVVHQGLAHGMETDEAIEKRVKSFFHHFFKNHQYERVLMVAHSHVIKALLVQFTNEFTYDAYLSNCAINIVAHDEQIKIIDYNINPLNH